MLSVASSLFKGICCLLTQCQEREGANGYKGGEEEEIHMHYHAAGLSSKQVNNTHVAVTSLSTLDAPTALVLHIQTFVSPEAQ